MKTVTYIQIVGMCLCRNYTRSGFAKAMPQDADTMRIES